MSAVRKMLVLQIRHQFTLSQSHGNVTHAIGFILVVCPGTVDGDKARQSPVIDDPHGQVAAAVAEIPAVQDALCRVPPGTGDDGVMVLGRIAAVFYAAIQINGYTKSQIQYFRKLSSPLVY